MTRPIEDDMTKNHGRSGRAGALAIAAVALAAFASPARAQSPEGLWLTEPGERQAKVKIAECGRGGALCSEIVWLKEPNDSRGKPLRDMRNKDESQRGRPILGMPIISNMQRTGERTWRGSVYNPEDGNTYKAHLTLVSKDKVQVKGCALFGMICGEKLWTRTAPEKPKQIVKPKPEPSPEPETKPARVEVPPELWMDPAELEQLQAANTEDDAELKPSITPPTAAATVGTPNPERVQPAAAVPVPEQKPEKPAVAQQQTAEPKPAPRRRSRARRREVLPWLAD